MFFNIFFKFPSDKIIKFTSCLVPYSGDVLQCRNIDKEKLWDKYYTSAPERRKLSVNEIRESKESISFLAKKYNISPTTVQKWKQRKSSSDSQMGNGRANSVLTPDGYAVICAARRKTWLALDDLFDHLKPAIAKLTRSNLHRCLQHHGISPCS